MTDRQERFGWDDIELEDDLDEDELDWDDGEDLSKADFDETQHPRDAHGEFVYDGGREADNEDKNEEGDPVHADVKAKGRPEGGSYRRLRQVATKGEEVHHMPANESSHLDIKNGPAIIMPDVDHKQTASYGTSREAMMYRRKQRDLIINGKWEEAQQMDIEDLRSKFGNKYDDQIKQMLAYDKTLKRSKRDGKPLNPTPAQIRRGKA